MYVVLVRVSMHHQNTLAKKQVREESVYLAYTLPDHIVHYWMKSEEELM